MKGLFNSFIAAVFILVFASSFILTTGRVSAQNNTAALSAPTKTMAITADIGGKKCEIDFFNPLTWIICPVMDLVSSILDFLYNKLIVPLLKTQPLPLPGQAPSDSKLEVYSIWSNFRIIGNIVLVIVLLVIVFGESIGGGLIDAYTVKKMLPRLLIGAVLINLSIYIVAFGLDVTNIVGSGIKRLIEAPFPPSINVLNFGSGSAGGDVAGFTTAVGGAVGGAIALDAFGPLLIIIVILPAVLAFLVTVLLLIVRQALIMLLVYLSPIAFALWCLPNTEKYFAKWWKTLFSTLLIFPIISVLFAVGNVASYTIGSTFTEPIKSIIMLIGYVAPFYIMPFSFQFAGGIMAAAAGMANKGITKPAMGRMGQARQKALKERVPRSKWLNGDMDEKRGGVRGGIAKAYNRTVQGGKAAATGRGIKGRLATGRAAQESKRAARAAEFAKTPNFQNAARDDKVVAILGNSGGTRGGARRWMDQNGLSGNEEWEAAFSKADSPGLGFDATSHDAAQYHLGETGAKALTDSGNGNLGLSGDEAKEMLKRSATAASPQDGGDAISNTVNYKAKSSPRPDLAFGSDYGKAYAEIGPEKILTADHTYTKGFIGHYSRIMKDPNSSAAQQKEARAVLEQLQAKVATTKDVPGATITLLNSELS